VQEAMTMKNESSKEAGKDGKEDSKSGSAQGSQQERSHGKNALEWTIFGLSVLLVGGMLAYLALEAISGVALPPRLEISLGVPVKAGEHVLVPVTVKNKGEATAAGVEIEVKRRKSEETAHFSFPYLPREGQRNGWVVFDAPLDKRDLKASILGYEES
jgi:uncharacterized protein (TIGR02588 family)